MSSAPVEVDDARTAHHIDGQFRVAALVMDNAKDGAIVDFVSSFVNGVGRVVYIVDHDAVQDSEAELLFT